MNDRNVDQILDVWLDLGPDIAPDRVHSAVALEVRTTRQAFGLNRWASERFPRMSTPVRVAVALAAVAIIAFVGFRYLVPDNTGDTSPSTTPTPTPSSSPTATPVGVRPLPQFGGGRLDPGQYSVAVPDSPVTATIAIGDDGWSTGGWYIMDPPDFSKQVSFWTVANVHQDWCDPESLPEPAIGPTVDDLVAALDAQENTDMSPAVDVEVGGFAGKRVTIQFVDLVQCNDRDLLSYFVTPSGPGRDMQPGRADTLWILNVDGNRVVICSSQSDPEDTAAATAIAGVIDSLELAAN
jgi:hypothetical protein